VQGVFFRESTRRQANHMNITGHAINLPDGRVEVLACGDYQAIDQLLSWLHRGPELSHVADIQIEEIQVEESPQAFITR
jgi:acylphosphatase